MLCRLFWAVWLQQLVPSYSSIIGTDPWYATSDHYWSLNNIDSNKHILDTTGYKKSRVYGGADVAPGVSKNGLQLDGVLSTGANLGNFSSTCLSLPSNCKTGFTVALWIKLNTSEFEDHSHRIILQVSRRIQSIGTTFYAKKNILGLSINDRNLSRTIEIRWTSHDWTHLALVWNKVKESVDIYLNCKKNEFVRNNKFVNRFYMIPPQYQLWLGSNYALMKNCKMTIDELAIWYDVLTGREMCYIKTAKAVDGGFTQWSNFSSCSTSCGPGTKLRTRTCTNPPVQHGGAKCLGVHDQTFDCFLRECPIDGNYTTWSEFTQCSKSCGRGERRRFRTCSNPTPNYGGRNCTRYGDPQEILSCNTQHCPIDGGLSEWSNFTECSSSCGDGMRKRTRTCANPPPQHGGKTCSKFHDTLQKQYCFLKVCPVDGNYSNWSSFTSCTRTCGGGSQSRQRTCDNPAPVGEGRNCSHIGPSVESRPCKTQNCPVHGGYSSWSPFTNCTKSCGGGIQTRTRNCTNPPPAYGGDNCTPLGPPEETSNCNIHPCPVDGRYGRWSKYGGCTTSCGGGKKKRVRLCDQPLPLYGGRNCSRFGPATETSSCNAEKCPDIVFLTTVVFLEETFKANLYDRQSEEFKTFSLKIHKNVKKVYGSSSSFDSMIVRFCEQGILDMDDNRPSGIQCMLELRFLSVGYEGIVALQDAFLIKGMLNQMRVQSFFISSSDVPTDYKLHVQAYNTSTQSIMVTWVPSAKRGSENVKGYRVMYTDEMGNRYNTMVDGPETGHVELKNLKVYQYYCIRILPFNWRGDGLATFPVCTYTDQGVPAGFPENLTVHRMKTDSMLVTWIPLRGELTHGELLGYRLRYYKVGTVSMTHNNSRIYGTQDVKPTANRITLDGLKKFSQYGMQIGAYNKKGLGEWSDELLFYTAEDVPGKSPLTAHIYNTSSTSLFASWYPIPRHYHYGLLLGYRIFYKDITLANDSHYDDITVARDVHEAEVIGLRKYRRYVVQVAGFNHRGEGAPSKAIVVSTEEDAPSLPPQQVTVANTSSTSLLVQWSPVPEDDRNGIVLGYNIAYRRSGTNKTLVLCCIPDTSAADITSLRKFTAYDVQILAYTAKGNGPLSDIVTARTAEDKPSQPPTFLSLYNTSSTSLRVTWLAIPPQYVHGVLLGYRVLYRSLNVTKEKYTFKEVAGPTSLRVILTDLWKYMDYAIRVLGYTKKGVGTVSDEVLVRTDQDVPSWPPENVQAANKSSPTKIPVRWQPISDQYYVHGILLGYKVKYKAVSNPDETLNEPQKVLVLGPNVHSVTIVNLTSYTIYAIEVLAFTIKGDGVASKTLFAETCNCHRSMYTNWWLTPPYTDHNVTGIFPTILKIVTAKCCEKCAEHSQTKIDFENSDVESRAVKPNENAVRTDIEYFTEMHFPVTGRDDQQVYDDFAFIPLVESGGTVFMTIADEPGYTARMVVKSVFQLWPMCMAVFVSAFFAGILMWLLDTFFNTNEFPRSPFRGPIEGMWWAFITMTTLGYGDRVPKAFHSKSFGIVWITCGLVIVALFMSFITTSLTTEIMSSEKMVYGSKIAAVRNSSQFRLGIRMNGVMDKDASYEDLTDVYRALKQRSVEGILVDSYSAGSRQDLFADPELRITKIISQSSTYGVVLAGKANRLQKCYRKFLKDERARVFAAITSNLRPIEASSSTDEKTESLFDAESEVFQQALIWTCVILGVVIAISLVHEFVARKTRDPNPVRHDYSIKTSLVPLMLMSKQENHLGDYNETREIMLEVVREFHEKCKATSQHLRIKHRREIRQLHGMKEQAEMPDPKEGASKKISIFDEVRKAIVRLFSGILPTNAGTAV